MKTWSGYVFAEGQDERPPAVPSSAIGRVTGATKVMILLIHISAGHSDRVFL